MRPLARADLSKIQAVFTDVDGTLTTRGVIESTTIRSLERLRAAKIRVVLVSGRSSAWGECWIRTLPIDGAILENGGLYYARRGGNIHKAFVQPPAERRRARARLLREVARAMTQVRGARLSRDSAFTEVNVAIDYNEDVRLGPEAAARLEVLLRDRGVQAVRSSVHVNCWVGAFDKLSTLRAFSAAEWGWDIRPAEMRLAYVGDSFNDAPLFAGVPLSVGVGNVRDIADELDALPAFVTRGREGAGFGEVARRVLAAKRTRA